MNGDLLPASADYTLTADIYASTPPVIGPNAASVTALLNGFDLRP